MMEKELICELSNDIEEVELLCKVLQNIPLFKVEQVIMALKRYGCHNDFIKEIIMKRTDVFRVDVDQLEYSMMAILANGDIIEETLLDVIVGTDNEKLK